MTERLAKDYRVVFATPEGERVLADLLRACHVLEPVFSGDALEMAHREGMRNVALRIVSFLHYAPDDFRNLAELAERHRPAI